jgi:arabinoxylan arabinofuranohydrolase
MGRRFLTTLSLSWMSVTIMAVPVCWADNPIIQTKFTADPAPMVYNDRVYLYTSHDEDNATGFTMYNWLLYSSTDMVNWTDHGIIGGVSDPYKTFKWAQGYNAWAPQAVQRNGKFYLYCPMQGSGRMQIGVAVSDSPTGPFVDAIGGPLINNPNSTDDIDPTILIDEDGQAYLYWGHQRLFYVKLNQNMISYSGSIVELPRPSTFEEGPWLFKREGRYYLAFASTCCPEGIGYAMSSSPTGPWTTKGHIMKPNNLSSGNHPGIVDYKGSSYVFGFNYALNLAETSTHRERRSVCVEKMTYKADGTIPEVPWWSTTGAPQIGTLNPFVRTEAETIASSSGLKTESCGEGGMDVSNIENGDYIKVKGVDFGSGATSLEARVASGASGGNIEIRLDDRTGTLVGTCAVSGTGGWQTWTTKSCTISGASGVHDLLFVFTGGSGKLFNFNWWKFSGPGGEADGGMGGDGGTGADAGSGADGGTGGDSGAGRDGGPAADGEGDSGGGGGRDVGAPNSDGGSRDGAVDAGGGREVDASGGSAGNSDGALGCACELGHASGDSAALVEMLAYCLGVGVWRRGKHRR